MSQIQQTLSAVLELLNQLETELKPFEGALKSIGCKPLAEAGASEKIKMAVAILKIQGAVVPFH